MTQILANSSVTQPLEVYASTTLALAIDLSDISLTYTNGRQQLTVLQEIDLQIAEREFVCVLGASGCGKTSLLRIIAGYEHPTAGEVRLFGKSHREPNPDAGVVFQHANLFPWLSVEANVEFGLKMMGVNKAERREQAAYYMEQVGLLEFKRLLPYQLSGGMKQRVAIARALMTNPKVLLMDEPFAALDAITRESLQLLLHQLAVTSGKTIFFITHDVDEALLLSSRILVMKGKGSGGQFVEDMSNPLRQVQDEQTLAHIRGTKQYADLREHLVNLLRME